MRYFVTGATGFLGGAITRMLREAGHEVKALVRSPARASDLSGLGVSLHAGDISDPRAIRAAMEGADGVFHVAGWYKVGVRDRAAAVGTNIDGTRHVLDAMRELGIPKGVYTSTLAVNSDTGGRVVDESYGFSGRHISLYDWSKHEAHKIAERAIANGLPLVIVQPGLVYGPGDTSGVRTMLVQYLQRRLKMIPSKSAYAWAHIEDEARGHILAMERGTAGRAYFLAGPVHTIVEALQIAQDITGIPAPRIHIPPAALKLTATAVRLIELLVTLPPAYASESLRVLAGVTYLGSSARARKELGWHARPLRDGLTETLRHEMRLLTRTPGNS